VNSFDLTTYLPRLGQAFALWLIAVAVVAGVAYACRHQITADRVGRAFRLGFVTLIYAIVAAVVLNAFMARWGFGGDRAKYGMTRAVTYTSIRPYVYRVLTPAVINGMTAALPESAIEQRRAWLLEESPLLGFRRPNESWDLEKSVQWHVAYAYLFLTLMIALVAARGLTRAVYDFGPLFVDLAPAVALMLLPITFQWAGYSYDFPELAFLFVALLAIVRQRWWLFYPVFVLAILNKESSVLIVLYFVAFAYTKGDLRAQLGHVAAQLLIGVVLLVTVRAMFAGMGGEPQRFYMPINLLFWFDYRAYTSFATTYAPLVPMPRPGNVITLFLLGVVVAWGWSRKPPLVRTAFVLTSAVILPLTLVFGFMDEARAMAPMFPPLYLLGCHTVAELYEQWS